MNVEFEREVDGQWIAEMTDLPGAMAYGQSREEVLAKVKALALRILADRIEHSEHVPELAEVFAVRHKPMALQEALVMPAACWE